MKKELFCGVFLATLLALPASAQQCRSNFNIDGLNYTTSGVVQNVTPEQALPRLAQHLRAEGFLYVNINQGSKSISAVQDGAGSGRPQAMRVTTRPQGNGTRISIRFTLQPGQFSPPDETMDSFCELINAAR